MRGAAHLEWSFRAMIKDQTRRPMRPVAPDSESWAHEPYTAPETNTPGGTMTEPSDAKAKAATTYNAAADYYDDPALGFWDRFGQGTVDRLELHPGGLVLDLCAGTGASAMPAALRVGP